ncbi:hypothetical protein, conserved [Leishmania tarentolae]|uniref:Uncharacterized protein n=1 Tax=Leishmania tarentolae TaxID=5689 RepID=A0A640KV89_LEITA|nr:hypothetical protein, conserved [Leishmania tarentolae]
MTSNPYIAHHYGSSMEVMSNGRESEIDASVGFRRFQNAPHMIHTVFRPSKNLTSTAATAASSSTLSHHSTSKTLTPDALSNLRLHKGLLLDDFPSRPHTPHGAKSAASLPPLLPADHLSVGCHDGLRERGAGVFREWVKASTNSAPSSSDGTDSGEIVLPATKSIAHGSLKMVTASVPAASRGTKNGESCTSVLVPPGTLVPAETPFPWSQQCSSVSVSPDSPGIVQPPSSTAPLTLSQVPEKSSEPTVDAALHRLRDVLVQAQRALDNSRTPGDARALPAPPAMPPEHAESAQHQQPTATLPASTSRRSSANADVMPEDVLDCVSPMADTKTVLNAYPGEDRRVCMLSAASLTSPTAKFADNVAVPDETRFMVLCAVTHPSVILEQRLRRRGPAKRASLEGPSSPPAHSLLATCKERGATRTSSHRIAEVPSTSAAVSVTAGEQRKEATGQLQRTASPNAGDSEHPSSRASTQPNPADGSISHCLHEDPSLIPGLAEFLRAGNPNGFSSLSAATHVTPPAPAKASPSARRSRRRSGPPTTSPSATAAAASSLGYSKTLILQRGSSGTAQSQGDLAVTPSLQLPYACTEGSTTVVDVSPRRGDARARRVELMPSYAQPTLSWLYKGPESSTDHFPVSHVASPQTSPMKDPATTLRDCAPGDPAVL